MKFSLILGTLGRTTELSRFLNTLSKQTYLDFELIVVDQNVDDRLIPIISSYGSQFKVIYLRSKPGLSRARNVGIQQASGNIIAFPDDDCCYPEKLLEEVFDLFRKNPEWDGVTGCPVDPKMDYRISPPGKITLFNAWHRGVSYTIFLRRHVVTKVGGFDETLGVGAGTLWGGSEEIDYLIRAMQSNFKLYYEPTLLVQHPGPLLAQEEPSLNLGEALNQKIDKVRRYSMGDGRVLAKSNYPLWFVIYQLIRPIGGAFLYLFRGQLGDVRIRLAYTRGKLKGWLSFFN